MLHHGNKNKRHTKTFYKDLLADSFFNLSVANIGEVGVVTGGGGIEVGGARMKFS